jgi:hypothetical protein
MLTFDDIVFRPHPSLVGGGLHGLLTLPTGETFSVTRGRGEVAGGSTADEPYEVYVCGHIFENMTSSKIDRLLRVLQKRAQRRGEPR